MKKGRLIIISAPSGAGKTSVIRRFLASHPNMVHSISCTTRPKRGDEVDGRYYHFMSDHAFRSGIENGRFAEWAEVHGHLYGTPIEPIEAALRSGKDVLLDLDVVGGLRLKGLYKERAVSLFLLPPSREELRRRLIGRGTDSPEQQELRLGNALEEMKYKDKYDHCVVNDDLEKACLEIEGILGA
jgi:guanylate kinase